jgi:hypothetical protein
MFVPKIADKHGLVDFRKDGGCERTIASSFYCFVGFDNWNMRRILFEFRNHVHSPPTRTACLYRTSVFPAFSTLSGQEYGRIVLTLA